MEPDTIQEEHVQRAFTLEILHVKDVIKRIKKVLVIILILTRLHQELHHEVQPDMIQETHVHQAFTLQILHVKGVFKRIKKVLVVILILTS